MHRSTAYLLIAHGSRDPRPHQAVDTLAHTFWQQLSQQTQPSSADRSLTPIVGTAMLELAPLPLHEQIARFAQRAAAAGHRAVDLLPLFLLPGVHVMEDLPAQIAIAQQQIDQMSSHGAIDLRLMPHVGANAGMSHLVQFSANEATARIVLAHGTKRAAGNQPIEAIAAYHRATPAYWAIEPGLRDCVQTCVRQGYQMIEIQPYFLFPGGITDAIAQQVEQLSAEFEATSLQLLSPLGMTPALTDVLMQMATASEPAIAV